jgi:hypothetical protein
MRPHVTRSSLRPSAVLLGVACAAGFAGSSAYGGVLAYALTEGDGLVSFDVDNPARLVESVQTLSIPHTIGIDFRPSTQRPVIAAIGGLNDRQLTFYEANNVAGFGYFNVLERDVRPDPTDTTNPYDPSTGVRGTRFGVDFDDVRDRIIVVSNNRNVYTVSFEPGTFGQVTTGPDLFYAPGDRSANQTPNIVHIADGGPVLYGIDSALDTLVSLDILTGEVRTIGDLGSDLTALGGFDILASASGYEAFLEGQPSALGQSYLYRVNLTTGAATGALQIDGGELYDGLTVPEPATGLLAALGGLFAVARRRR